jgi:hypothetical protein
MTTWYSTGTGGTPTGISGGSSGTWVVLTQERQASSDPLGGGNLTPTAQTFSAPSGKPVMLFQTDPQTSTRGDNPGPTPTTEFLATGEPVAGAEGAYWEYSAGGPVMTATEWQAFLEFVIPA